MSMVEMGWPARFALPRRVTVQRFAMFVSAVGASVGHLDATDTAALLIKMLTHDRLAVQCENLAFELAFIVPLSLGMSDVDANGRWWAWVIRAWTLQACWSRSLSMMVMNRLFVVNDLGCQLLNELCRCLVR